MNTLQNATAALPLPCESNYAPLPDAEWYIVPTTRNGYISANCTTGATGGSEALPTSLYRGDNVSRELRVEQLAQRYAAIVESGINVDADDCGDIPGICLDHERVSFDAAKASELRSYRLSNVPTNTSGGSRDIGDGV